MVSSNIFRHHLDNLMDNYHLLKLHRLGKSNPTWLPGIFCQTTNRQIWQPFCCIQDILVSKKAGHGFYILLSSFVQLFVELKEDSVFDSFLRRLPNFGTSSEYMSPLSFWSLDESIVTVDPVEIINLGDIFRNIMVLVCKTISRPTPATGKHDLSLVSGSWISNTSLSVGPCRGAREG